MDRKLAKKSVKKAQDVSDDYDYGPRAHGIVVEPPHHCYHTKRGGYYALQFVLDKKHHKKPPLSICITGVTIHPQDTSISTEDFLSAKVGDKVSFKFDFCEVRLYHGLIQDGEGLESGLRVQFCYSSDYRFEKSK